MRDTNTLTTVDVLEGAIGLLESPKHGWCRGVYHGNGDRPTTSCLVGAIEWAAQGVTAEDLDIPLEKSADKQVAESFVREIDDVYSRNHAGAYDAIEKQLVKDYGWRGGVIGWNDQQRDKRKVVRMIRRAIKRVGVAA